MTDADLALALDAVAAAARAVMEVFRSDPDVRHKEPGQPVTVADLRADDILRERLTSARPDDGWLSEETPDRPDRLGRRRVWIVDPIDGTRSFIAGRPEFAISVALAVDGEVVLGIVHNPASGELFWARSGSGAHRVTGWTGGGAEGERLRVSTAAEPALLASRSEIGRGEFEPFAADWTLRPLGSTAFKLAAVAAAGGAYLSRGPKSEWDVAAGVLIVEEAGGRVTDLKGERLRFNRREPYVHGVVAGAPSAHGRLLERAGALRSPRLEGRAEGAGASDRGGDGASAEP